MKSISKLGLRFVMVVVAAAVVVFLLQSVISPNWWQAGIWRTYVSEVSPAVSRIESRRESNKSAGDIQRSAKSTAEALRGKMLALLGLIRGGAPPREVRCGLLALRSAVHGASPDEAAAVIIGLLSSGEDVATGLGFVVGPEGVMDEPPTWRTALLDFLGQTDPAQSVAYSRVLLGTTGSADEYALALRNLGWGNPEGRLNAEIRGHFSALLTRADWRRAPTVGYLEAFDLAVAVGALTEVATEIELSGSGPESSVSRAAFVALDRIMLRDPRLVVGEFTARPDFLADAPFHRASLLSRLDVRDPEQVALLARYLQRPDHAPGELEYFSEVFPNGNRFAGHRLVTSPEQGGGIAEMAELDRATLEVLRIWQMDGRYAPHNGELVKIIQRLQGREGS